MANPPISVQLEPHRGTAVCRLLAGDGGGPGFFLQVLEAGANQNRPRPPDAEFSRLDLMAGCTRYAEAFEGKRLADGVSLQLYRSNARSSGEELRPQGYL